MTLFSRMSTLRLLGWFAFSSLVLAENNWVVHVSTFKLSGFDFFFVAMCLIKFGRLAEPDAYALPSGQVGTVLMFSTLSIIYLMATAGHQSGIDPGDVFRDLRVVIYFLLVPFICYKDINTPAAYRTIHKFIVASGVSVSLFMLVEQLNGFSISHPVRDLSLGIWVIPFAVVSLLYFRTELNLKVTTAYAMILFMIIALIFSLNRSQYLQLMFSVAVSMVLGARVNAMRRGLALFMPALAAGMIVFYSLGYMNVLADRVFSVQDLQDDSSYGSRVQEYEGQMELFRQAPIFGQGAGYRSWVMGETGFELSTFAHNSWAFYLMKFGIFGTIVIMWPGLLIILLALMRGYADPRLELHRRYLISCMPAYIFIDSLSGGLSFAPKTAFLGFLLCYALSLIKNNSTWSPLHVPQARVVAAVAPRAQTPRRRIVRLPTIAKQPSVRAIRHG
jgi:O-antigen ligase